MIFTVFGFVQTDVDVLEWKPVKKENRGYGGEEVTLVPHREMIVGSIPADDAVITV